MELNFAQIIIEDALITERTNQRRLYSAAVANNNDFEAQKIWDRIQELNYQIRNIKEDRNMKNLEEMTSKELKELAKKLKVTNWWKLSKAALIHEIRINTDYEEGAEAEEAHSEAPVEPIEELSEETKENTKTEPKRANKKIKELTYKGKTQSIKAWAEELGMPWPTLYDRVNRNGWSVEDAIETPLGQRRPK